MLQPFIGNTKISKLYKGSELWCNWSNSEGGSDNDEYLLYSFTNFDVENSIANKKIYSDNNNAYLEIIGDNNSIVLERGLLGNLRTNGTLALNVECKDKIKDNFTIELELRIVSFNTYFSKKVIFQCISGVTPYDGFKVMCNNTNLNLLSFVDNLDIQLDDKIITNDVVKLKLTKGNNILKLYKNDNLVTTGICTANWTSSKQISIGGNLTSTNFLLGTYDFISLRIYDREV